MVWVDNFNLCVGKLLDLKIRFSSLFNFSQSALG